MGREGKFLSSLIKDLNEEAVFDLIVYQGTHCQTWRKTP